MTCGKLNIKKLNHHNRDAESLISSHTLYRFSFRVILYFTFFTQTPSANSWPFIILQTPCIHIRPSVCLFLLLHGIDSNTSFEPVFPTQVFKLSRQISILGLLCTMIKFHYTFIHMSICSYGYSHYTHVIKISM